MTDDDTRRCIVCHHRELEDDEPQTCRRCVTVTRSAVVHIVTLHGRLGAELRGRVGSSSGGTGTKSERPLPMAELLSLMGPGGDGYGEKSDTPSVAWSLASWEDDWRTFGGFCGSPYPAGVERAAEWLLANLGTMAQRHPAFDEFAGDMRSLRMILLRVLGLADDPLRMNADCFACGQPLVRDYAPAILPLPHPSWRNTAWLRKNPWFETEVLPYLRQRTAEILA